MKKLIILAIFLSHYCVSAIDQYGNDIAMAPLQSNVYGSSFFKVMTYHNYNPLASHYSVLYNYIATKIEPNKLEIPQAIKNFIGNDQKVIYHFVSQKVFGEIEPNNLLLRPHYIAFPDATANGFSKNTNVNVMIYQDDDALPEEKRELLNGNLPISLHPGEKGKPQSSTVASPNNMEIGMSDKFEGKFLWSVVKHGDLTIVTLTHILDDHDFNKRHPGIPARLIPMLEKIGYL